MYGNSVQYYDIIQSEIIAQYLNSDIETLYYNVSVSQYIKVSQQNKRITVGTNKVALCSAKLCLYTTLNYHYSPNILAMLFISVRLLLLMLLEIILLHMMIC